MGARVHDVRPHRAAARSRRADARATLLQAAQYMQRFYAANDRFDVDAEARVTLLSVETVK